MLDLNKYKNGNVSSSELLTECKRLQEENNFLAYKIEKLEHELRATQEENEKLRNCCNCLSGTKFARNYAACVEYCHWEATQ